MYALPAVRAKFILSAMVLARRAAKVSLAFSVHLCYQAGNKMLHLSLFSGQKVSLIPLHNAGV